METVATHRREKVFEGLLAGCAVGEALALNRNGLHPRVALKMFGRNPLEFRFIPAVAVPSHRTHAVIITAQAILESRTDRSRMLSRLKSRLSWYQRSFPFRHLATHFAKSSQSGKTNDSRSVGLGDDPLIRAVVFSVVLQGAIENAGKWIQTGAEVSHADVQVLHACALVGHAAQLAQFADRDSFEPLAVLETLKSSVEDPNLSAGLEQLQGSLERRKSVCFVARKFGWDNGIPSDVTAFALIAIYAWLRHHRDYRRCVERCVMLGGECGHVAALAGALVGITHTSRAIPKTWRERLNMYPYNQAWHDVLIDRVKDWPHGVEDIQRAQGVDTMMMGQVSRNCLHGFFRLIHAAIRFPMRSVTFSIRKRR
jgi:ADP-ribosylglycohydrolase